MNKQEPIKTTSMTIISKEEIQEVAKWNTVRSIKQGPLRTFFMAKLYESEYDAKLIDAIQTCSHNPNKSDGTNYSAVVHGFKEAKKQWKLMADRAEDEIFSEQQQNKEPS
jgi:hypothetical protein